jgi:hypothetical protein
MAKSKTPAKKKSAVILAGPKKGEKGYTASKLAAHLAASVAAKGLPEISKKQAAAVLESLVGTLFSYATVGAKIPGLGKVVLREIPAKPARTIVSFGKEISVKAKPKSAKLVFRFSKEAKEKFKK